MNKSIKKMKAVLLIAVLYFSTLPIAVVNANDAKSRNGCRAPGKDSGPHEGLCGQGHSNKTHSIPQSCFQRRSEPNKVREPSLTQSLLTKGN